jgi:DNA-binding NtrC family response regulator
MVLIFDRDAPVRELMRLVLADIGLEAEGAATPCERLVRRRRPELMIVELPNSSAAGVSHLIDAVRRDPALGDTPIIVSSTNPLLLKAHRSWLRERRCHTIVKPFDIDELLDCVSIACAAHPPAAACPSG